MMLLVPHSCFQVICFESLNPWSMVILLLFEVVVPLPNLCAAPMLHAALKLPMTLFTSANHGRAHLLYFQPPGNGCSLCLLHLTHHTPLHGITACRQDKRSPSQVVTYEGPCVSATHLTSLTIHAAGHWCC